MTQTLVVPTHYEDLAELAEGLAERVESDQLILFGPAPFDEDTEITFQVLLGDESVALEGRARAVASVDGGDERDDDYRYDIVLHALELNDRFMAVYDRILLMRDGPSTNEHEAVDVGAVEEVSEVLEEPVSDRIDQTTEFGAESVLRPSQPTSEAPAGGQMSSHPPSAPPAQMGTDEPFAADGANVADDGEITDGFEAVEEEALAEEVSVVEATPEELLDPGSQVEVYSQPPSIPPGLSSRPPSTPPRVSSLPPAEGPVNQLESGARDLFPEPTQPEKPPAPQVSGLGEGLSRPSAAQAYSLEPDDEETLYPSPTGLFQYAKSELPAPQAPARPQEHSFRPIQPAPSMAPIAPRGSAEAFAVNLPSLRPIAMSDVEITSASTPPRPPPEAVTAPPPENNDIDSVPVEALDEIDEIDDSIPPEPISADAADVDEIDEVSARAAAEDSESDDEYGETAEASPVESESISPESLSSETLSGDSLPPEREV